MAEAPTERAEAEDVAIRARGPDPLHARIVVRVFCPERRR